MPPAAKNIDDREITCFDRHAADWWQPRGRLKALHDINPLRLQYIAGRADPEGREVLDVGCGGGILSEGLARAGARVTGIDLSDPALAAARAHREISALAIDYRKITAEALAEEMPGRFDLVVCMELLEHVPEPRSILAACRRLAKPGADVVVSTINRTWLSGLLVILVAEHVLGIVEKGTHHFRRFIPPRDLARWAAAEGLALCGCTGYLYVPILGRAYLTGFSPMNYMMHLQAGK